MQRVTSEHYSINRGVFSLDEDYEFASFRELDSLVDPGQKLAKIQSFSVECERREILMRLIQRQTLEFGEAKPLPFSVRGPLDYQGEYFFMTDYIHDDSRGIFKRVTSLTPHANSLSIPQMDMLRHIPDEELSQFGVGSLKKLVRESS